MLDSEGGKLLQGCQPKARRLRISASFIGPAVCSARSADAMSPGNENFAPVFSGTGESIETRAFWGSITNDHP